MELGKGIFSLSRLQISRKDDDLTRNKLQCHWGKNSTSAYPIQSLMMSSEGLCRASDLILKHGGILVADCMVLRGGEVRAYTMPYSFGLAESIVVIETRNWRPVQDIKEGVVPGFEILSTPNINCARKYFLLQFSGRADDLLFEISKAMRRLSTHHYQFLLQLQHSFSVA